VVAFSFEALGIQRVSRRFNRLGAAAVNMAPAWEEILQYFFYIEDEVFTSQGRRGGGSWAEDTPEWLAQKARLAWDPRINFATWALYDAMTVLGAPGQIIEEDGPTFRFGTDLPQAGPSQKHRPFIKLMPQDRFIMADLIGRHFIREWEAGV
jgi:hypothetical protein